jgi:Na+/H+-dicarboxylate symporter
MKIVRIFFDLAVLAATTILIIVIANYKFSGTINSAVLNGSLLAMHVSLLFAGILNCVAYPPKRNPVKFFVALFPVVALALAFVLSVTVGFSFGSIILLGFDFYLVYAFFWLLLGEKR